MHDAIVISGWTWDAANVPERFALALAYAGSRVLYCENPVSPLRKARRLSEVDNGVFAFSPRFLGHRLNFGPLRSVQARLLADTILKRAAALRLREPIFVYPHGDYSLPLCREFKRRGFRLINICMDYEVEAVREHVRESDLALVIPRAAYEELHAEFGDRVRLIPQFSLGDALGGLDGLSESASLRGIPRPRLGYLGNLSGRISLPLLQETLVQHPEWHFVSFERKKWLPLANEHVLSWRTRNELRAILAGIDVGFMPYDSNTPKNLHCVPLKLFDYFACGLPVVSTPITFLRQYEDLVYIGSTGSELSEAVSRALSEPADSPKKKKRVSLSGEHSIARLAGILASILN
jgi:glycosyltransferase involved in cell wall biosynthesis